MWQKTGDLACDTCGQEFNHPGPRVVVANAARAKNWHLFHGKSLTGKPLDVHLCPICVGTSRSAIKTQAKSLDEDVPLF
jgi:hypothetical protein